MPYDPEISLLDIYAKTLKAESQRGDCTHEFTAAFGTITKRWKQSECLMDG